MPTNNTYQVFDTEMVQQIHTVFVFIKVSVEYVIYIENE